MQVSRRQHHPSRWYGWVAFAAVLLVAWQAAQLSESSALDITPLMYRWNYVLVELGCIVPMLALMLRLRRRVG